MIIALWLRFFCSLFGFFDFIAGEFVFVFVFSGLGVQWWDLISFFFFFFFFLLFLGPLLWHMEVPRPGVESEL